MKQAADKHTLDIITGKRPRGRPAAAHPKTEAERKAAQRARAKAEGVEQLTISIAADLVAALRKAMAATSTRPERTQREVVEAILRNQLLRER